VQQHLNRREFLKASLASAAATQLMPGAFGQEHAEGVNPHGTPAATADSMIVIWLPGGVSQSEYWDPKPFTPFEKGMKGSDLLNVCPVINTSADGISLGAGLEEIASVMHHGAILRTLSNYHTFAFDHTRAQYHLMTGYPFPTGFKAPGLGAKISRVLGPREPNMPPFIVLGRETLDPGAGGADTRQFVNGLHGSGFYGMRHAPLIIKDPTKGLEVLNTVSDMNVDRLDRRQAYLEAISGLSSSELRESAKVKEYMTVIERARALMDSPLKDAFAYKTDEPEAFQSYKVDHRFGESCLLARRLVERGARYVQVEYPFRTFEVFDTHKNGSTDNQMLKTHIDRPIANLIRDLDERGMLDRTLVVIMSEFGRTLAKKKDPSEKIAFATSQQGQVGGVIDQYSDGSNISIDSMDMYGMHGHFPVANNVVFFGGGIKGGTLYGETAARHPMVPLGNQVNIDDLQATLCRLMGISPELYYVTEGRPIHMTNLGKGTVIDELLA
jgi:hypothetical protein